ncbi:hypothetical protein FBU59_003854 [Linderina macrospora]|uniref:Uncharacterized protein n=1 Tax=Linderina macrospora TaxID=4868 RepID=A0ACC1J745_9FUNG|nr:hypothetical protein FBU59_003854 [Linderina macrospora]
MDWWNQGDSAALNRDMPSGSLQTRWFDYARDILAVVRQLGVRQSLVGIGHSWGAANLQLAEIMSPLTFAGLFLVESATPIEITPEQSELLAVVVRKRRFQWKSIDDARAHFENHSFSANWDKRILELFIQHGLEHDEEKSLLKCLPGPEADGFAATAYGAPFIGRNLWRIQCPCVYLTASESDKVSADYVRELIAPMRDCEHYVVQGRGHLLLHEDPVQTAEHCIQSLDKFALKLRSTSKL